MDKLMGEGKIMIDVLLKMQELTNDYGFDGYNGQINEAGVRHGVGRLVKISGEIYEGMFKNGYYHGFGRELAFHYNYTGNWNMGMPSEPDKIEWVSDPEDSFFDQTLLQAKNEMSLGLGAYFMKKVKAAQKVASYSKAREEKKKNVGKGSSN